MKSPSAGHPRPAPIFKPLTFKAPSLKARTFVRAAFIIAIYVAASSCGKVGAPVPPARITERTAELAALQRGANIILSWPAPVLGAAESSRSYIARADIYRLRESRTEEPVLDADDYEESAELIGFLDRAAIEAQMKSLGHLQYSDTVRLDGSAIDLAGTRLRYAVRYVNKRGQAAAFSNTVAVEPAAAISNPPASLRAVDRAQDEVVLTWAAPASNVDGTAPAATVGYNLYRRQAKRAEFGKPINSEPVTETTFTDRDFQYQADYVYVARALSQGANGLIESADSEPVSFTPVDRFPPSSPDPLSVASANGVVSLFWPTSPERDVAGYNVYRAEAAAADEKDWVKLNAQPVTAVTYRDDRVTIDRAYSYRVTAVDRFGNESAPSRAVSETAHP